LVHWPSEHQRRAQLAEAGIPRLLLVTPGSAIPTDIADDEDWVRLPASERDLAVRLTNLEHRFREAVRLDDRVLRTGDRTAVLSDVEARVMAVLLESGAGIVPHPELAAAVGPGAATSQRRLHDTLHRLRQRLRPLGLDVFVAPRQGYSLGLRIDESA
jgi:DNA-binding winged helix-turn-helix (wHTH) protein